jgi:cytochrome c
LISSLTAISMITGVFHFMAISFVVNRRLRSHPEPVNSRFRPWLAVVLAISGVLFAGASTAQAIAPSFTVLVFSKTTGFRHDSIPDGVAAIRALGAEHHFAVDAAEDAAQFTDATLSRYKVVVFLCTTGDILDPDQKAAFERYIASGGGFVGIHSASDTEYHWPWYGRLVGAWFASHPQIQRATIHIEDANHPSTKGLPASWERTDEWYNFRSNPRSTVHVLASLDEATYSGGAMGGDHPIAWCQNIEGGRSWYTAMGHTQDSYAEPLFRLHLLGGIESTAGSAGDCSL